MQSLADTMWRVIEARAFDEAGRKLLPIGPKPRGFFEAERMLVAVVDARASLPPDAPPRFFVAYTGTYRFDGVELVTRADDASKPELIVDQVRRIRFEGDNRWQSRSQGCPGQSGTELVWERVGQLPVPQHRRSR
jgi:hypothetical protein